jgi:endonuclease/exonuclease/phosphatase (EEP) superfamily protein YafD
MQSDILRASTVWTLRILAMVLLLGTASSLTQANQWWIRIWDFPRTQILIAMLVSAMLLYFLDKKWRPWFPIIVLLAAAWQFYRIYPYTPLAAKEVSQTQAQEEDAQGCFKVLTFNVLQTNRDYASTLDILEREDADIVLMLETDTGWREAMMPQLSRYSTVLERPLSNTYGLILATRLPARGGQIIDLAEKDTPSAFITLTAGQTDFYLMALHPRPPHPSRDTEERDAELVMAAERAAGAAMPVLAIGDFNDVAWSSTSRLFKQVGEFLDPRIGRGTHATFPANMTWLGWPLDHLFMTEEFLIDQFRVLEYVGSDHRPVVSRLCLAPKSAERRNEDTAPATREDASEAAEVMDDYREDSAADAANGE